jgi:hypothetical protein
MRANPHRLLILTCSLVLLCFLGWISGAGADKKFNFWDGDWTDGSSGTENDLGDKDDTTGKSGNDPPQWFFIPSPRQFKDVDPEDLSEQRGRDYTPYAMARLISDVRLQDKKVLKKGYYQVKLGQLNDGSQANHLDDPQRQQATILAGASIVSNRKKSSYQQLQRGTLPQTLVMKQLGKVIVVFPISRREPWRKEKGDKRRYPKPLAGVVQENRRPVLKYFDGKMIYSSDLPIE